jgi:predicted peptidase
MGLIEQFVADHPTIDTNRIYIGGCSNGGYMTVKMVIDHPDYFAAAFPAAEAYSVEWLTQERIDTIKHLPMWLTHALNDSVVTISSNNMPLDNYSSALFNRLVAAGNKNVHYSLFNDVVDLTGKYFDADGKPYAYHGHWSWIYTLNNDCKKMINGKDITLFEWLCGN